MNIRVQTVRCSCRSLGCCDLVKTQNGAQFQRKETFAVRVLWSKRMRARIGYAAAAVVLTAVEILIALYVRDAFIRPYGGDILVTVLLCCLGRAVLMRRLPYLPFGVFLFAAAVELAQACGIASLIPEHWTVVRIAVGSAFSVWDLVCYAVGCALFVCAEWVLSRRKNRKI